MYNYCLYVILLSWCLHFSYQFRPIVISNELYNIGSNKMGYSVIQVSADDNLLYIYTFHIIYIATLIIIII